MLCLACTPGTIFYTVEKWTNDAACARLAAYSIPRTARASVTMNLRRVGLHLRHRLQHRRTFVAGGDQVDGSGRLDGIAYGLRVASKPSTKYAADTPSFSAN
jgi:hypothetical protein